MSSGTRTISHTLPMAHYDVKIQQQEQYVNVLFDLINSLQQYIIAGQNDLNSSVLSLQNHVPGANSPLGKLEKAVKINRAKREFMEATNDHKVAVDSLRDMKFNYENIFLPDYTKKINEALEKWDSLISELENYPEIKAKLDKDIKDRDWDINNNEVKLNYSDYANSLISQAKVTANGSKTA